jgi:predicted CXXCH cytochrome family protein
MSKIKLSFSFLLTLLLVGMFSVVALAAPNGPTQIKATVNGDHDITLDWEDITGATEYNVYLDGVKKNTATISSSTYELTDVEAATTLEIEAITAVGNGKSSFAWNALLDATKADDDGDYDNGIVNANGSGSNVGNQSDKFSDVIKSDAMVKAKSDGTLESKTGTHRTHGEYQNNTNSCASCHQTHTGASKNLLFKNGEYTTCTACHDGTLGFYNVFTGSDSAGTFGGTHDGNMSVHLANGTVQIKAAPGGNRNAEEDPEHAVWTAEFTCASCHAPHGSFSDRLLHPNPNHMGTHTADEGGQALKGIKVVSDITSKVTYTTDEEKKMGGNFVMYKFTASAADAAKPAYFAKGVAANDVIFQVMKWDVNAKDADGNVVPKYVEEKSPWLHGYDWDLAHTTKFYWSTIQGEITTKLIKDTTDLSKGQITKTIDTSILNTDSISAKLVNKVVQGYGFMVVKSSAISGFEYTVDDRGTTETTDDEKANRLDKVQYANISRAYLVDLDEKPETALSTQYGVPITTTTVTKLWDKTPWLEASKNGKSVSNAGVAMSGWCSSCHTDYLAGSGEETGTYSHAYRHTTTSDNYTCVRCHYAHGTDVTIMRDAQGKKVADVINDTTYFPGVTGEERNTLAKDYMLDKNPSSALKRYTNMSVCWGCHTSSHSEGIRNASSFENLSGNGATKDKIGILSGY